MQGERLHHSNRIFRSESNPFPVCQVVLLLPGLLKLAEVFEDKHDMLVMFTILFLNLFQFVKDFRMGLKQISYSGKYPDYLNIHQDCPFAVQHWIALPHPVR
jgi:hypothetical protein